MHRFFIFYTAIILLSFAGFSVYAFTCLDDATRQLLSVEHGVIEILTAGGFALVAVVAMAVFCTKRHEIWGVFTALMALAAAREMDWHKAFTTDSVLKTKFYVREDVPVIEKFIGGAFIVVLVVLVVRLARYVLPWIKDVVRFQPMALSIGLGMGMLVIAKTLDSLKRLVPALKDFHVDNALALGFLEETLELTATTLFLGVCLLSLRSNRP